jgi:hypothetical protein
MSTTRLFIICFVLSLTANSRAEAGGNFPLASCKGWDGTIVSISGVNSRKALLKGRVTRSNIREYCERDPGGETVQFGGKQTVDECVENYYDEVKQKSVTSIADCSQGSLTHKYGEDYSKTLQFPINPNVDSSCASGIPPLELQFKLLCPQFNQSLVKPHSSKSKVTSLLVQKTAFGGRVKSVTVIYVNQKLKKIREKFIIDCNPSFPQVSDSSTAWELPIRENAKTAIIDQPPIQEIWLLACRAQP